MYITPVTIKTSGCYLIVQKMIYISVYLSYYRRDMHLLSKIRCNLLLLSCKAIENTWEGAFITSYHIIHVIIYASMISYFLLMHIGSSVGITLLEFDEELEEQ